MSSLIGNSSFHSLHSKLPSKFSMVSTYPRSRSSNLKIIRSMPQEKIEMFESLENWAEKNVVVNLKPIEQSWQPTDFLPNPTSEGFDEQVKELRERAKELPDDYFVTLVGHMVGEEALVPIYLSWLNSLDGTRDQTGASLTPWAIWTRGWSAEENKHGDLLNKYLYLCGRVDMRQIEKTTHYMISSGMDFRTEHNPYLAFIYTSIQERATFTAHGNAARLAKHHAGDIKLAKLCGTIAADEKRHENVYTTIVGKLFELDPDGTVLALADLLRKNVSHPAHMMYDGRDDSLFQHFSAVSSRIGVFGAKDYAEILEFFLGQWKVKELVGLSSEGRKAQDYVCTLSEKMWKMVEKAQGRVKQSPRVPFSWIFDKQVKL